MEWHHVKCENLKKRDNGTNLKHINQSVIHQFHTVLFIIRSLSFWIYSIIIKCRRQTTHDIVVFVRVWKCKRISNFILDAFSNSSSKRFSIRPQIRANFVIFHQIRFVFHFSLASRFEVCLQVFERSTSKRNKRMYPETERLKRLTLLCHSEIHENIFQSTAAVLWLKWN